MSFAGDGGLCCLTPPPMDLALRIALITEHASPLALACGVDAGGQNVYVAHVARGPGAPGAGTGAP